MKLTTVLFSLALTAVIAAGCSQIMEIKGSISGTVYMNGRPLMGQIQVLDPKTKGSVKTEPVKNSGHFIIPDVKPGEYLLAVIGPAGAPLGEFMYVRVAPGRPVTGIEFEVTEVDPKVQELLDKVAAEAAEETSE